MASRDEKGSDKGRVKVRVIEFEMEGSNQTLRDSIRDMVGAIGRSTHAARTVPAALGTVAGKSSGNDPAPAGDDGLDAAAEETIVDVVDVADAEGDKPRRRSPPAIARNH